MYAPPKIEKFLRRKSLLAAKEAACVWHRRRLLGAVNAE